LPSPKSRLSSRPEVKKCWPPYINIGLVLRPARYQRNRSRHQLCRPILADHPESGRP
jgi:hypothetical protein